MTRKSRSKPKSYANLINIAHLINMLKRRFCKVSTKQNTIDPPSYNPDSYEAMVYIASLAMLADKKIKKAELKSLTSSGSGALLVAFNDAIRSNQEGDIHEAIDIDKSYISASTRNQNWIKDINKTALSNLEKYPTALVLESAAKKITKKQHRTIVLLGAVRVIACDLHIDSLESKFLNQLADCWNLQNLLDEIITDLPNWEQKRTERLLSKITNMQNELDVMVDEGSISMEAYGRLEDRIAKHLPSLEIEDEWEVFSEELLEEINELNEKTQQLAIDLAKTTQELERQGKHGNDKESIAVVMEKCFSGLDFHKTSHKVLLEEFSEKADVYRHLLRINSGKPALNKPVRGTKKWKEIAKVKTGNPSMASMGRLYFKEQRGHKHSYKVYLSVKKNEAHQNQTVSLLRHWN